MSAIPLTPESLVTIIEEYLKQNPKETTFNMQQKNGEMSYGFSSDPEWKRFCVWSRTTSRDRPMDYLEQERQLVRAFTKVWERIHPNIVIHTENGVIYDGWWVERR